MTVLRAPIENADILVVLGRVVSAEHLGAVLLTVGRSYVGNDVTRSTLLDRAGACSYENLPKYRSYRVSNTAPRCTGIAIIITVRVRRSFHAAP